MRLYGTAWIPIDVNRWIRLIPYSPAFYSTIFSQRYLPPLLPNVKVTVSCGHTVDLALIVILNHHLLAIFVNKTGFPYSREQGIDLQRSRNLIASHTIQDAQAVVAELLH